MKITPLIFELSALIEGALDRVEMVIKESQSILLMARSIDGTFKSEARSIIKFFALIGVDSIHYSRLRSRFATFKAFVGEKDRSMSNFLNSTGYRLDDARANLILLSEVGKPVSLVERAELRALVKRLDHLRDRLYTASVEHKKFSDFIDMEFSGMNPSDGRDNR